MKMPGQRWLGMAASFVAMRLVMMAGNSFVSPTFRELHKCAKRDCTTSISMSSWVNAA
jgi:hypothetical protein